MFLWLAELTWTTGWWMACVAMLVVVAGLLGWGYAGNASAAQVRVAAILLKLGGFALLAACLLEPLWRESSPKPGANLLAIVVDESRSLQVREAVAGQTRAAMLQSALDMGAGESGWMTRLEGVFQLRKFALGSRLSGVEDFSGLEFSGESTSIQSAVENLKRRFQGRPLAAILLFTDGGATDLSGELDLEGLPPVFPVLPGAGTVPEDLSIVDANVTRSQFEDSPVTVQARVGSEGFAGKPVVVRLLDESGKEVAREAHVPASAADLWGARFRFRPEQPGLSFYQVEVLQDNRPSQDAETEEVVEATGANNRRTLAIDRGAGPFRILYVSGRPNWEFKFMSRALQDEEELALVGLLRIARKEARFDFRGRAGESSNPLFRGFDKQAEEEAEQYDEAVLVRMNTRDAEELAGGFPKEAEELFGYHAVIVDDLEAGFFKASQQALLEAFVNRRGGGFLMLGGLESFREGGFARTPVGGMLPVYLHAGGSSRPAQYRWQLTREGWLMPWARLRSSEAQEREALGKVPAFRVLNQPGGIKPGAVAVAGVAVADGEEPVPALVEHRYGRGRVMALTVGDLWRWGLRDPDLRPDMERFWRQALRRLVADVPGRISVEVVKAGGAGSQTVTLEVRAFDEAYQPLDNVEARLAITEPAGDVVVLDALPSAREAGLFQADYLPRSPGAYRVEARVLDESGDAVGKADSGWVADFEAKEYQSLAFNKELLDRVARETGGEVVALDGLQDLAARLPELEAPVMEVWSRPLWHNPWVFLCALGLFGAEWVLRRMKGLP